MKKKKKREKRLEAEIKKEKIHGRENSTREIQPPSLELIDKFNYLREKLENEFSKSIAVYWNLPTQSTS